MVHAGGGPDEPIDPRKLAKIGVLARVSDRLNLPGGSVQATIQGLRRIRLVEVEERAGYFTAQVREVSERNANAEENEDLIARILVTLEALAEEVERVSQEVPRILRMNVADASRFADLVVTLANFSAADKDKVIQRLDVRSRLRYILQRLESQLKRAERVEEAKPAEEKARPAKKATPADRANELRQQIKKLQSELGEIDPVEREAVDLLRRIEASDLPAKVATQARIEVERLRTLNPTASDASEIRSYLDWVLNMPWNRRATDGPSKVDLVAVQHALDEEHLGLEEPKERVLDYLAVAKLRGDLRGPIPCLVGPPGVGKTTIVEALARGLGRPIASLDLGGRGESQLIGSRRTRAGAQPGKIIAQYRDVEVRDPVFVFEEMDQIGLGKVEGDPIEAMEQALTWNGRAEFVDRYIDIEFDLSDTLFIATAQD